VTLVRI